MSLPVPSPRPTFEHELASPPAVVADALAALLARYPGRRAGTHLMLTVPPAARHFWSPWLTLDLGDPASPVTRLHGRFSPAPALWTAIGLTHLALLTTGFFALMFAGAQWTLGAAPRALWVALGCAVAMSLLWWASLVGQRLAYEQMHELRAAVEAVLEKVAVECRAATSADSRV